MTQPSGRTYEATTLVVGRAEGAVLVLDEALSFWGGFDTTSGRITDRHHPQTDLVLTKRILVLPSGRGSSSSSSVLAEAIRVGTAPAALVLREADPIIAIGALVAAELYGQQTPVVQVTAPVYQALHTNQHVIIIATGDGAHISFHHDPRASTTR